jgi:hypothetical protein
MNGKFAVGYQTLVIANNHSGISQVKFTGTIAVPETAVPQLPRDILVATSAVVVDTGNYYPARNGRIAEIDDGLTDSEWVARVLGRPVVKAFNNIVADSLAKRRVPTGTLGRICLSVAGDDPRAKELVLGLIDALGFDGIDAGMLADSWRQHPGTPAYCRDLDADGLKAALAQLMPGKSLATAPKRTRLRAPTSPNSTMAELDAWLISRRDRAT